MSLSALNGLLCIDKPQGMSSFDVIRELKRAAREQGQKWESIGHGGTLDPFATGLIVIAVGQATKITQYLLHGSKRYSATLQLGVQTASGDLTAEPVARASVPAEISAQKIYDAVAPLLKPAIYAQIPPMYSALKHEGQRLYTLARQGQEVAREPRSCSLWDFELTHWNPESQQITFAVSCSGGTYIRTLGEDIAQRLGTLGHLTALRREQSLHLDLTNAVSLAQATQISPSLWPQEFKSAWIPLAESVAHLPHRELSQEQAARLASGQQDQLSTLLNGMESSPSVALYLSGSPRKLVGIAQYQSDQRRFVLGRIFQREIGN